MDGEIEQEIFELAVEGTAQVRLTLPVKPLLPPTSTSVLPLWLVAAIVKFNGLAPTPKPWLELKPGHAVTRLKPLIVPNPDT